MNEKYERQMKKGVLDMLVLKLLRSEAKYGYQIIQAVSYTHLRALDEIEVVWKRISDGISRIMEE